MTLKRTKIICTIGPSSWDPSVVKRMIESGMNCARVNGAFADRAELEKVTKLVRDVSGDVALMLDTKGPEVRLNKFPAEIELTRGKVMKIGSTTSAELYPANNLEVYKFLKPGQVIRVGDGDVEMVINEIDDGEMICEVTLGEVLKPGKALNFPGAQYSTDVLTQRDKELIQAAKELNWDFISASFIKDQKSAQVVSDALAGSSLKLIAKIEDMDGVNNLDEIFPIVYGIMVARGGLGVELGLENVPAVQDEIIKKCIKVKKTVIVATQFLESMITNPRPTRAEVDDVANCIEDRVDAVMLSGESASGQYPVEAVKMLTNIAIATEPRLAPSQIDQNQYHFDVIQDAAIKASVQFCVSSQSNVDVVVAISEEGGMARLIGKYDIVQPIYAIVRRDNSRRYLAIDKGVVGSFNFENKTYDHEETIKNVTDFFKNNGILKNGMRVLIVSAKNDLEDFKFPAFTELTTI